MKVLIVSFLIDPWIGGGAATSASRLCQGLAQQGAEVVVVTTHNEPDPRTTFEQNIRTYYFRPRNLYWVADNIGQPLSKRIIWQLLDTWNPQVYAYLRQVIRQERPDIVHIHKFRGLSPSVWAAAAIENGRPIIQTCRDYEVVSPEGTLNSIVGRWALERRLILRPYQALRSHWSNQVDVVTAPSQFTLNTITDLGFFSRAYQLVVPNSHGWSAVELDKLADNGAEELETDPGKVTFLYMGRLAPTKGIDILCEAFAGVAGDLPNARLEVAGKGALDKSLRARYTGSQIRFHGHVSGAEKHRLIARSHVLLMPSVYQEVFGNSIIEAYAFGKPVLASRIGGMPELVCEGETGFLVKPGDVEDLQRVIRQIAAEPAKLLAMSPACRQAARAYTLEAVTSAYLKAYELGMKTTRGTAPVPQPREV
jgi:glycosyltransferase involved in cell wall biosynthesis